MPTDRLLTGQRLDATGVYYYGARYYDRAIGRFISPDTIVPDFRNPQALNRYSYVINNPLKYTDPTGHDWEMDADGNMVWIDDLASAWNAGFVPAWAAWEMETWQDDTGTEFALEHGGDVAVAILSIVGVGDVLNVVGDLLIGDLDAARLDFAGIFNPLPINSRSAKLADDFIDAGGGGGKAFKSIADQENKLHHIFDNPRHNLTPLVEAFEGSQNKAAKALEVATQDYLSANKVTGDFKRIVVDVEGIDVTVSGTVINGQAMIGTAFIPR